MRRVTFVYAHYPNGFQVCISRCFGYRARLYRQVTPSSVRRVLSYFSKVTGLNTIKSPVYTILVD